VPVCLLVTLATSGALAWQGDCLYQVLFAAQAAFYGLAFLGSLSPERLGRVGLFYIPTYFTAINVGALLGLASFLAGRRYAVWQPIQRHEAADGGGR